MLRTLRINNVRMNNVRMNTVRMTAAAVLAAALAVLCSACSAVDSDPMPTTSIPATPTPSSEAIRSTPALAPTAVPVANPVDPLTTVVALVIRPTALTLKNASGTVVQVLEYMGDVEEAVKTLTSVVGAEPASEWYPGSNHYPPGVYYTWGDLVLEERLYDPVQREQKGLTGSLAWPHFRIFFEGPASSGVLLSTETGLRAGVPWPSVEQDPGYVRHLWTCDGTAVDVTEVADSDGTERRATVIARASDDGTTVLWLGAPELEADGCA